MNTNTISLVALAASLLFTGAYLQNAISGRREVKEQLRELKAEQERTMRMVDSINTDYARKKLEFLQMNQKLYSQLDTILDLKVVNSQRLRDIEGKVRDERIRLDDDVSELKDILRDQNVH